MAVHGPDRLRGGPGHPVRTDLRLGYPDGYPVSQHLRGEPHLTAFHCRQGHHGRRIHHGQPSCHPVAELVREHPDFHGRGRLLMSSMRVFSVVLPRVLVSKI